MNPPPPPSSQGPRPRTGHPLRLVPLEPAELHPLTTLATPLLPARGAAGGATDVWEELDRAAAWVCDDWSNDPASGGGERGVDDRDALRQALRVLCVAARAADLAGAPATDEEGERRYVLAAHDLPWNVPIERLLRALQRRLVVQTVAAEAADEPRPEPAAVLRVLAALDRLDEVRRADATRTAVDQLTGATSLDLLVEVAHDMRSPLGSILFLVERLRLGTEGGGALTEAQDRQLALVYGAAFGLSAMAGDVMELARGGDRLASGDAAPLLLPQVVETVCGIARPLAEEKRLALVVGDIPPQPRLGHEAALQRVLLNLTTNALKYTPAGSVTVWAEALGRSRVAFMVEDTGPGIPPHVLANLFQTFRQRPARGFAFSSSGLGLAICRKLIGAMGGELEVQSDAEHGTRFRFELELPRLGPT